MKHLNDIDEKLKHAFQFSAIAGKKLAILPEQTLMLSARQSGLSVVCEQNAAACLLAGTLKRHRVVAINMATVSTPAMRLESQKAKE